MIVELICHTDGCINNEVIITLETEATRAVCGPCGEEILDKTIIQQ